MKKKIFTAVFSILIIGIACFTAFYKKENEKIRKKTLATLKASSVKKKKKTQEERRLFAQERLEHELKMQRNPQTGKIPLDEKRKELESAMLAKEKTLFNKATPSAYISRGPTNLGGRTRAVRVDLSDGTSNTMLAGGVTGGLFRTTNGGTSWAKVSPNDETDNVTAIAQDPRPGFQNIWYYGTGEWNVLSTSVGVGRDAFRGQGIWKSTDNGVNWTQIPKTNSNFEDFDSSFDYIAALEVNPNTGDLTIATPLGIYRYDGTNMIAELITSSNGWTDVAINSAGRVFAAIQGNLTQNGVWTSPTGKGSWTRIAQNGSPSSWLCTGRIVLSTAPSNNDVIYALYENGNQEGSGMVEADLWKYDLGTDSWTNYTGKVPDEPGGDLPGNDPFAIQGGYDLGVSVKPDDENFVLIGGTNAYKIDDITTNPTFSRIGGYASNTTYSSYTMGGDEHHPDIHDLEFDPHNPDIMYSGTDGGVHKTINIVGSTVTWQSLNNNYQTYQYYHVAIDQQTGSNIVFGGAQDNGTTIGGTHSDLVPNNTDMAEFFGSDGVAVGIARRNGGVDVQLYYGAQNGTMFREFLSRSSSIAYITPEGSQSQFVTYFYLDPDNTNTLYYVGENLLYRTNDAENVISSTWDNLGNVFTLENIERVAATRGAYNTSDSYLLIGGDEGGIFRVNNPHNTRTISSNFFARRITPLASNTDDGIGASTSSGTIVSGLAIHPTNPDIVLATYANYGITNIFLTTNATDRTPTWKVVERNLASNSIRSATIAEVDGKTIYFVGTYRGLYSSTDPTTRDWEIEGANEMGFVLVSSLDYRPSDNKLLIGTHGNGMYEATVLANTLSTNSVSNNELGVTIYPNPAASELNITGSKINFNDIVKYQISDVTGKLIQKGTLKNKKVDVQTLVSGMYIINLEANGLRGSLKFLKQ